MINRFKNWLILKLGGKIKPTYGDNLGTTSDKKILNYMCREELIEVIARASSESSSKDWFMSYYLQKKENKRLNNLLRSKYYTDKDLNHAIHVSDLEVKNKKLKREIRNTQEIAEHRNAQLNACNLITYCTGGCDSGIPDKDSMTEQKVKDVEAIAGRLRSWWNNYQYRQKENE